MSRELELRSVHEENAPLAVPVSEYEVQMRNLQRMVDEEYLHGVDLLQEPGQSNQEMEGL